MKTAIENDELTEHMYEEHQFWPNEDRPKIRRAMTQIKALKEFLEKESSEEFHKVAAEELGDTPDIKRRSFWKDHLL